MIPSLKIKYNLDKEVGQFMSFLHHPYFPRNRNKIFQAFPELKDQIDKTSNEKDAVIEFVTDFNKKHKDTVDQFMRTSELLLRQYGKKALEALASLMDYEWNREHQGYTIIHTILPFSPFGKNLFYFSLLGIIRGKKQRDVIYLSVHEISHMLLQEILEKEYKKPISKILDITTWNFFKEIMAPALMNQPSLQKFLKLQNYMGNPFLHNVFIDDGNRKIQISKFFQEIYEEARLEKRSFRQILDILLPLILSIKTEIENKNKLWNQYGNSIVKNKIAFKEYSKPMEIKKPGK